MMKQIKMRYGLLFLGTQPQFYFWEVIILIRKLLVIFASNFLASVSEIIQCLSIILVVIANMMYAIRYRPFQSDLGNYTNLFSQVVQLIRIYCGIYYITAAGDDYSKNMFMNYLILLVIIISQ